MGKRERNERETEKSVDRDYMRENNYRKPGQKKTKQTKNNNKKKDKKRRERENKPYSKTAL